MLILRAWRLQPRPSLQVSLAVEIITVGITCSAVESMSLSRMNYVTQSGASRAIIQRLIDDHPTVC